MFFQKCFQAGDDIVCPGDGRPVWLMVFRYQISGFVRKQFGCVASGRKCQRVADVILGQYQRLLSLRKFQVFGGYGHTAVFLFRCIYQITDAHQDIIIIIQKLQDFVKFFHGHPIASGCFRVHNQRVKGQMRYRQDIRGCQRLLRFFRF